MTIVVHVENEQQVEQLIKQLHKQIDVLKVRYYRKSDGR